MNKKQAINNFKESINKSLNVIKKVQTKKILQEIRESLQDTLECEKESFNNGNETDKNIEGWIEALEHSLFVINDVQRRYTEQGKL
tara:strand:+ start:3027 stop:3284 length:258 start_codon:yes stop_codon:yes gene_type:complete